MNNILKYQKAINNISNYSIYHWGTEDEDGYSNFDDWEEHPFYEDENIKLIETSSEEYLYQCWKKGEASIYKKVIKDLEKIGGELNGKTNSN